MTTPVGWRVLRTLFILAVLVVSLRAEQHSLTVKFAEVGGISLLKPALPFGVRLSYLPDSEVDAQLQLMELAGVARVTRPKTLVLSSNETVTVAYDEVFDETKLLPDLTGGVTITVGGVRQTFRPRKVGGEVILRQRAVREAGLVMEATITLISFEGWWNREVVEYGNRQVGLTPDLNGREVNATVTQPVGFSQPVFSMRTRVEKLMIKPGLTTVLFLHADWVEGDQGHAPVGRYGPLLGAPLARGEKWRPYVRLMVLHMAD